MTLTANELAAMRDTIAQLLPDTCYILSGTATSDGAGELTYTWGTTSTASCRIDPVKSREQISGEGLQLYNLFTLTVPYDTTVSANNHIQIGAVEYAVVSVIDGNSWALDKRLQVEKL